jgi:hypothetical protein
VHRNDAPHATAFRPGFFPFLAAALATGPRVELNREFTAGGSDDAGGAVDPQTSTDWTGSVRVAGGKLRVDRTMAFEKDDRLLGHARPDTEVNPTTISHEIVGNASPRVRTRRMRYKRA